MIHTIRGSAPSIFLTYLFPVGKAPPLLSLPPEKETAGSGYIPSGPQSSIGTLAASFAALCNAMLRPERKRVLWGYTRSRRIIS